MNADHTVVEAAWVTLLGVVFTAGTALIGVWVQARKTRKELDTGNGHTIGQAVARLEDTQRDHEMRLDRIEVRQLEDSGDIKHRLASAVFDQERHLATYRHDRRLVDEEDA